MDVFINVGISALLEAVKDKKGIQKYKAAIAKVYVKIGMAATLDSSLAAEIARQRQKEGLQ